MQILDKASSHQASEEVVDDGGKLPVSEEMAEMEEIETPQPRNGDVGNNDDNAENSFDDGLRIQHRSSSKKHLWSIEKAI